jgi:predicted nucleic acid-binding protein
VKNVPKSPLDRDWERFMALSVTRELVWAAGNLAEKHGLRGFDAIHLASAVILKQEITGPVLFSCGDQRLQKASKNEGLEQP